MGQITTLGNAYSGGGTVIITDQAPTINNPVIVGAKTTANVTVASANGAIAISPGVIEITKAGVAAMTLAAPTAGGPGTGNDGQRITIVSTTANAHTVTFTGATLNAGVAAAKTTATFAAFIGAGIEVMAMNAVWIMISSQGVTLS